MRSPYVPFILQYVTDTGVCIIESMPTHPPCRFGEILRFDEVLKKRLYILGILIRNELLILDAVAERYLTATYLVSGSFLREHKMNTVTRHI